MDLPPPFDPSVIAHPDPEAPLSGPPVPWASLPAPSRRDGPPWWMTEMIDAEPALSGRLLRRLGVVRRSSGVPGVPARLEAPGRDTPAGRLAAAIRIALEGGDPVVVTGCGTSEHGAMAFAAIVGDAAERAGLRGSGKPGSVLARQAFEASLAPQRGGLIIGISHEGGTGATLAAMNAAAARRAKVAAVTVSRSAPIGTLTALVLETAEIDRSWCHTIGYLSPILAAIAVGAALTGEARDADPVAIRALLAAGLGQAPPAERIAAELAGCREVIVVASGADTTAGRELALKVEEATWLPTAFRDTGDVPARPSPCHGWCDRPASSSSPIAPDGRRAQRGPSRRLPLRHGSGCGPARSSPRVSTANGRHSSRRPGGSSSRRRRRSPAPSRRSSGRRRRSSS